MAKVGMEVKDKPYMPYDSRQNFLASLSIFSFKRILQMSATINRLTKEGVTHV